nr:tyrosine-type recombinase/integrase [Chthoniobacterales bacterium]
MRRFFRNRADAETFVKLCETELLNKGVEGIEFPSWLRVMAQRENCRLKSYGKTISDAADSYIQHLEANARSIPLDAAVKELIANRRANGASGRYVYDLKLRLGRFCRDFAGRVVADITVVDVDTWLTRLNLAPVTRNTFRRDLSTLFSFALGRKYCVENPVAASRKAKEVSSDIEILTIEQLAILLQSAHQETLPYWALGAFAGLRRAELERLQWKQVDFESNLIEIKARQSKTATRRLVTIQPNLADWLAPYRSATGSVCPTNLRKRLDEDRARAGLDKNWPSN